MPVYVVDKPLGLTSHDVVSRARRLLHTKRVGHTGTLDPLASGVLVLCVNDSTKLVQFMERDRKAYLAYVSLGAATPTLDAEGPITALSDVPALTQLPEILARFLGEQLQVPPQYSALQLGGQRAYAVARAGGELALPERPVTVYQLELLGCYPSLAQAPRTFTYQSGQWEIGAGGHHFELPPALGDFPTLLLRAEVGSGTYLRSLARDIGALLGTSAHLSGLIRTRAGKFGLEQASALEALPNAQARSDLDALPLPQLEVGAETALQLRQGKRPACAEKGRVVVTQGGQLVAVADGDGHTLKVVRAWN